VNRRNSNTPPSPAQRAPTAPHGDAAATTAAAAAATTAAAAASSSHNTGNSSGDENDSPAGYGSSLNGSSHGNGSTVMSRSRRGSNRSGASPPPLPPLPSTVSATAASADAAAAIAVAPQPYTEANPQQVAAAFVELVRVRQEQLGPSSAVVGGITVDDLLGWSEIRDLIDEDWLTEAQVRHTHSSCICILITVFATYHCMWRVRMHVSSVCCGTLQS
jgi:hypothetical protein